MRLYCDTQGQGSWARVCVREPAIQSHGDWGPYKISEMQHGRMRRLSKDCRRHVLLGCMYTICFIYLFDTKRNDLDLCLQVKTRDPIL